jgi:hypothetical protein
LPSPFGRRSKKPLASGRHAQDHVVVALAASHRLEPVKHASSIQIKGRPTRSAAWIERRKEFAKLMRQNREALREPKVEARVRIVEQTNPRH